MTHTISHDPFARTSLVRERVKVYQFGHSCSWCGGTLFTPTNQMYLYRYGTLPDDSGNVNWHEGRFCSKDCHDTYHMI